MREKLSSERKEIKEKKGVSAKSESQYTRCFNCGRKGHQSNSCRDRSEGPKCFSCNKFGHISKDCNKQREQNRTTRQNDGGNRTCIVHEGEKEPMWKQEL
ncbi:Zinc knuckle [Popillia japonica]|uniref:Zinc knuckle n=1 Tax=Popillia japonica TaxID=7064 RepID=A0AAW1LRC7_POPJA